MSARRAAAIAGMRELLDILEANPDAPLPNVINPDFDGNGMALYLFHPDHARDKLTALRRATPGRWTTTIDNSTTRPQLVMTADFGGIPLTVRAALEDVAEKTVIGTTVVEQVDWVLDGEPLGAVA